ncbi:MAG: hypothetical protein H6732_12770 [Alphaproteobacteria bacterium]|nr:hypothetical protein [Alphaproteobacteria bacterium]
MIAWLLCGAVHAHGGIAVIELAPDPAGVEVRWQPAQASDGRRPHPPEGCEVLAPWATVGSFEVARWSCAPPGALLPLEGAGEGPVRVVWRQADRTRRALSLGEEVRVPAPPPPVRPTLPVGGIAALGLACAALLHAWGAHRGLRWLAHGLGIAAAWVLVGLLRG